MAANSDTLSEKVHTSERVILFVYIRTHIKELCPNHNLDTAPFTRLNNSVLLWIAPTTWRITLRDEIISAARILLLI